MSFFESLFGRDETKVVDASALTWTSLLGMPSSKTGVSVNEYTALRQAVVFACCKVLTEDLGKLPLRLYLEQEDGTKKVAKKHPLNRIIARRPNQWQTSMEWRMTMMLHALLTPAGYSFINRSKSGEVLELIPLMPSNVVPKQDSSWNVWYEVSDVNGRIAELDRDQVHVLHGLSWDGVAALPVVRYAAEAIGLAIATEEAQARLHSNGARPGGAITAPKPLSDKQVVRLKANFAENYAGVANAFKTILLDDGMEFKPWTMSGVDAQQLETRRHQVEEICRFFRVFPSMIGFSDKSATYASSESFFLGHVVHTLTPWVSLWEQAMARDLLTEEELDQGFEAKFQLQGLLRGDVKTRSEFYTSGINNGWMTRNEARRMEDLNPMPGLDEMLQPLNMQSGTAPAPKNGAKQPPSPVPPSAADP